VFVVARRLGTLSSGELVETLANRRSMPANAGVVLDLAGGDYVSSAASSRSSPARPVRLSSEASWRCAASRPVRTSFELSVSSDFAEEPSPTWDRPVGARTATRTADRGGPGFLGGPGYFVTTHLEVLAWNREAAAVAAARPSQQVEQCRCQRTLPLS